MQNIVIILAKLQASSARQILNRLIQDNPPVERVVAVTSEPQFIFTGLFWRILVSRPF